MEGKNFRGATIFNVVLDEMWMREHKRKGTDSFFFSPVLLDNPRNPLFSKKYTFFVVRARLRRALSFY